MNNSSTARLALRLHSDTLDLARCRAMLPNALFVTRGCAPAAATDDEDGLGGPEVTL